MLFSGRVPTLTPQQQWYEEQSLIATFGEGPRVSINPLEIHVSQQWESSLLLLHAEDPYGEVDGEGG